MERHLAPILAADVIRYSRLVGTATQTAALCCHNGKDSFDVNLSGCHSSSTAEAPQRHECRKVIWHRPLSRPAAGNDIDSVGIIEID